MVWEPSKAEWRARIQDLRGLADEHGHINVPWDYVTADGVKLGRWVAHQRSKYHGTKKGQRLTPEQFAELDALGLRW